MPYFMTREMAVNKVFKMMSDITSEKYNLKEAIDTISLFGISAEELSEAGVSYENLRDLGRSIE